jgi:hypothetical protein
MITIDLPKSQYRRIGETPPSRWSWDWLDLLIVGLLLPLFALLLFAGGWGFVLGGLISLALWVAGMIWRPIGWLVFIAWAAGR